jgi:phage baseplate assembly protein W
VASKLYNQRSVGSAGKTITSVTSASFRYKGFSSKETNNNFKLYDIGLVKQDLLNHFYIRRGEKLENPNFGTIIWDILFEQFTPDVKDLIVKDVEQIINYDPRIAVNAITIDSTDQGIRIEADVVYLPFNINERMTFEFDRANNIVS